MGLFRSALKSAARLTIAGNWRTSSVGPVRGSSSGPVAWLRARGIAVQRVLSDNGIGYVARAFGGRAVMRSAPASSHARLYAAHNGKAQRFIQTLMQEWAYAFPYATSQPGRHAVRTGL
jgi:hypothetical protein